MDLPRRKAVRLKGYDYSTPGIYFVTVCTKNKQKLLGKIVGTGLLDGPVNQLSSYGQVAQKQIQLMTDFYDNIRIEKYVIMPNHIHFLIRIYGHYEPEQTETPANSALSHFIGTFKRFCNRIYGENIWQNRSYDHIVRREQDYREIWRYIEENPLRWTMDRFYSE